MAEGDWIINSKKAHYVFANRVAGTRTHNNSVFYTFSTQYNNKQQQNNNKQQQQPTTNNQPSYAPGIRHTVP